MTQKRLLVRGWIFKPHSYAIVNQWQCLELMRRSDVDLYLGPPRDERSKWEDHYGLMDPEAEARLKSLGPPPPGVRPDAILRLTLPVNLEETPGIDTYVLGTADFGWLPRRMIKGRVRLKEAHTGTNAILVSPSRWSRSGLIRSGADPDRVFVVPHGVDPNLFRPSIAEEREQLRRQMGFHDKFVFLNVSAMTLSKGTDLILRAFAQVAAKYDHTHLLLKGLGSVYDSEDYFNLWWRYKLTQQERTLLTGRVSLTHETYSFSRMAKLYQAADHYLTPYRSESFNMPALEAIASGLPIICTAGGPTDDYIEPTFARRVTSTVESKRKPKADPEEIVRVPDLDHLIALMTEAVEGADYCATARQAGPARVRQGFTWEQVVDRLLLVMDTKKRHDVLRTSESDDVPLLDTQYGP